MIAAAGGSDALAAPGERSQETGWDEIAAARPDVVVVMPCGLDADAAEAEARRHGAALAELGAEAFAVDAAASFSRPGPRLADGVELLGHLLHPTLVPAPPGLEARRLGCGDPTTG
jgi:iron complex transport system substrate-binding protein